MVAVSRAEHLPGALGSPASPQQASLSANPTLRVPRKLGALYFPRPELWPDLTARARLVIGGKIPKGVGGGRKAETNILNSLFCKRTLLGTLLHISFSSLFCLSLSQSLSLSLKKEKKMTV